MPRLYDCTTVQAARAYMVYMPESPAKKVVLSSNKVFMTINASLVHPITKKVYSNEILEMFSPITLVQSGTPGWYFIISNGKCSCGQQRCPHINA